MSVSNESDKTVTDDVKVKSPIGAWIPYVLPMAVFMIITQFEQSFGKSYPLIYALKVLLVTAVLIVFRKTFMDIRPDFRALALGIVVGILVLLEWIWVDPYTPHLAFLGGSRAQYDPFTQIPDRNLLVVFLVTRFYGLALMVPVMEELFWRSFLVRIFTNPDDFKAVRPEAISWPALAIVAVGFGLSHGEWLAGIICGFAYGILAKYTRGIFASVIAHGVTNLLLGVYVVVYHQWKFW